MTSDPSRDTFPRQYARTQRFTLGEPRTFTVSPDGTRVVFLRSLGGDDPVNCLWEFDVSTAAERLVVDPRRVAVSAATAGASPEELARRERLREAGGGITSYTVDDNVSTYAFAVAGQLFTGTFAGDSVHLVDTDGQVFDPRLDPTGRRIAYVVNGELFCVERSESGTFANSRRLVGRSESGEPETVSWGVADFIAAEEMSRYRGHWWNADGTKIAVSRVDESPVDVWTIADPAQPSQLARTVRYPAAGTANASVTLHLIDLDSRTRQDVVWDTVEFPYLADVLWSGSDRVLVTIQPRDQRRVVIGQATWTSPRVETLIVDASDTWVDLVPGSPDVLSDGTVVWVSDRDGVKRLMAADVPVTPTEIDVRQIVSAVGETVVFSAIDPERPEAWRIWVWDSARSEVRPLTPPDGVHTASVGGSAAVIRRASTTLARPTISLTRIGDPDKILATLENRCEQPLVEPDVRFIRAGRRRIPCAVILPRRIPDGARLPVLMDPYGGPHAQRVIDSYAAHCTSQWFADQGFAVVVADGRGTPGLGTQWEQSIHLDVASAVLEDQVESLQSLVEEIPVLDATRVAIRGWSFGGYLAALAVLERPDVFHAGIAGAPVTDWRLYDTHYTERYLGNPNDDDAPYERSSLLARANKLERPLLLIHGLADDNVVAAHTLQMSSSLLAAGKPHEVLPLSGVTHMTPQAEVAENLLLHQLDFLRRSLELD